MNTTADFSTPAPYGKGIEVARGGSVTVMELTSAGMNGGRYEVKRAGADRALLTRGLAVVIK